MSASAKSAKTYKSAKVKDSLCCGYGADGKNSAWGYDCLMIPGAVKGSSPYTALVPVSLCGAGNGLAYSSGTYKTTATPDAGQQKTVCCKYHYLSVFLNGIFHYSWRMMRLFNWLEAFSLLMLISSHHWMDQKKA